jgi:hypothetical protein
MMLGQSWIEVGLPVLVLEPLYIAWSHWIVNDDHFLSMVHQRMDCLSLHQSNVRQEGTIWSPMVWSVGYWRESDLLEDLPAFYEVRGQSAAEDSFDNLSWCFGVGVVVVTEACFEMGFCACRVDEDGIGDALDAVLEEIGFDGEVLAPMHQFTQ